MIERRTPLYPVGLCAALLLTACLPEDAVPPSVGSPPGSTGGAGTTQGTGGATTGTTTGNATTGTSGTGGTNAGSPGGSLDGGPTFDGGDAGADPRFGVAEDPACDLNGVWAGRQTTISNALNGDQIASNWYLMTLRQDGSQVEVLDHLDCGVFVRSATGTFGGVQVVLARDSMVFMADKNPQTGRKATVSRSTDGNHCEVRFDRFYSARGVSDPAAYLPAGPHDPRDLSALQAEVAMPTADNTAGAADWNGPAQQGLGVAWVVPDLGTRWSVQRDWTEWATDENHRIDASDPLTRVVMGSRFFTEENVLSTSSGMLGGGLLASLATPITDDPRAQTELLLLSHPGGPPHELEGLADIGDRCLQVQALLPHLEP